MFLLNNKIELMQKRGFMSGLSKISVTDLNQAIAMEMGLKVNFKKMEDHFELKTNSAAQADKIVDIVSATFGLGAKVENTIGSKTHIIIIPISRKNIPASGG